jgi:hypothetical protein
MELAGGELMEKEKVQAWNGASRGQLMEEEKVKVM